jgi:membrane associated rhomboid family serine protease
MFPFRVENPRFGVAIATAAIIALNLVVWIAVERMGAGTTLPNTLCTLGLIPAALLGQLQPGTTIPLGEGIACTMGAVPAWVTPLTSMFMHGGWFHLIGNMWFLWLFGRNVEDVMGPARYAAFYLLAGLAAAAAQVLADPGSALPMVGASGAISGVMGAYVVLFPKVRVHVLIFLGIFVTTVTLPAYMMLGYWFLLQVLGGSVNALQATGGGVAFAAHVGGFLAGALLVNGFKSRTLLDRREELLSSARWEDTAGSSGSQW